MSTGTYTDIDIDLVETDIDRTDTTATIPQNVSLLSGREVTVDLNVIDNFRFVEEGYFTITPERFASLDSTLRDSIGITKIFMQNVKLGEAPEPLITTQNVDIFAHTANINLNDPVLNTTFAGGSGADSLLYVSHDPFGSETYNEQEAFSLRNKFGYQPIADGDVSMETEQRLENALNTLVEDVFAGVITRVDITKTTAKLELSKDIFEEITDDELLETNTTDTGDGL
jgi:hypothetical protein